MKTSTETHSIARIIGEEKAVEYIAKAGFDAWDFSLFALKGKAGESTHPLTGNTYLSFMRNLKKIGLDNGIVCNQTHAPYPAEDPDVRSYLKRAIECTAEAGGSICVIHPYEQTTPEKNAEFYMELLPFAKACGVKIATENMFGWDKQKDQAAFAACQTPESFLAHLNAVNDEDFVACLDIGHAEMRGTNTSAVEMIYALGPKLQALHIHDNDLWKDYHEIPFSMKVDFDAIIKALKRVGYSGYLTLECVFYNFHHTKEQSFERVQNLAAAAKRLAQMWEDA